MLNLLKKQKKDELDLICSRTIYGTYSERIVSKVLKPSKIIDFLFSKPSDPSIVLSTKFNGLNYPVIDLDEYKYFELLKGDLIEKEINFAIFRSSTKEIEKKQKIKKDKHWIVLDLPTKNPKESIKKLIIEILKYSDGNYIEHTIKNNKFYLRAFCDKFNKNNNRLPKLMFNTKGCSENFLNLIEKLKEYYQSEDFIKISLLLKSHYKNIPKDTVHEWMNLVKQ